jgi:uncharacterized protein with PQ loop repeat
MGKYELLATVSLMTNVVAFYHQVYHIYATNNVSSYALGALLGNILAQILLIIYGIANKAYGIYGPTLLLLPGLLYITYLKVFEPVSISPDISNDSTHIKDSTI